MGHVIRSHDHWSNHSGSTFMGRGHGKREALGLDLVVRSVSSLSAPGSFP